MTPIKQRIKFLPSTVYLNNYEKYTPYSMLNSAFGYSGNMWEARHNLIDTARNFVNG